MNSATHQPWIDATANNVLAGKPIENIRLSQPDISAHDAYALQRQLIQQLKENKGWGAICGYKAALTAEAAQQAMGVHEPVIGVIDDVSNMLNGKSTIQRVENTPHRRHRQISLKVLSAVPHEGANAVSRLNAKICQRLR